MWRRMRLRIRLKAAPARRISVGPASRKSPNVATFAEPVHRPGKPQDRAHLAGHEVHREREQQQGQAEHPADEHARGLGVEPLARGEHAQDAAVQLNVHRDPFRLVGLIDPPGVEHERMVERFVEALLQPLVQPGRQQAAGLGRHAQIGFRLEGDGELEVLARQIQDPRLGFRRLRRLQQLDQETHFAGDAKRQGTRDLVPVALVEQIGQHHLQDQQRQNHDQERAAEQAAWDDAGGPHHIGQRLDRLMRQA